MNRAVMFRNPGVKVEVVNLSKIYHTPAEKVHALQEVNFSVEPGQAVAVMGPSGCGKTTLLNLIGGVDRPTSGKLSIGDIELATADERALEAHRLRRAGFVFQSYNLVPSMTALENLELPMLVAGDEEAESRERAEALLELVGLNRKGNVKPDYLSGGEQQRVGIAVALANDPTLILADEPTGNLDAKNAEAISELLVSLSVDNGKTVIMVSHDPKCVRYFPVEYGMRDGRFVQIESGRTTLS